MNVFRLGAICTEIFHTFKRKRKDGLITNNYKKSFYIENKQNNKTNNLVQ